MGDKFVLPRDFISRHFILAILDRFFGGKRLPGPDDDIGLNGSSQVGSGPQDIWMSEKVFL
jgi:hypothetical protein